MQRYLIFDTETTGLPVCRSFGIFPAYADLEKYNHARIVQVSYIIADATYNKLEESDTIIKAEGFKIENHQFHGITDTISETRGIPFVEFAEQFKNALIHVQTLVAHNLDFDFNVMRAELYRYNLLEVIALFESKCQICTMKRYKTLVGVKFKNSDNIKFPSLKELYKFATGKEIENQHNSMHDTLNLWKAVKALEIK